MIFNHLFISLIPAGAFHVGFDHPHVPVLLPAHV